MKFLVFTFPLACKWSDDDDDDDDDHNNNNKAALRLLAVLFVSTLYFRTQLKELNLYLQYDLIVLIHDFFHFTFRTIH